MPFRLEKSQNSHIVLFIMIMIMIMIIIGDFYFISFRP